MRRFLEAPALPDLVSVKVFSPLAGVVAVGVFEVEEVAFTAAALGVFAVVFDAVIALPALVGSGFLAGAFLTGALVMVLAGALVMVLAGALVVVLAGALAAGFAVGLVVGFLAGALGTGIAAGLETFLAGTLAAGFFAGALAAVFAGALALGLETFFTDALEATGLGLAAAALLFEALAFGFAAFDLGLAVGDLAAGFLDEGLDEGIGDGRWKRSVWVYYSYSMGTAEFPQAGRTKRERFGCVKGILKNKFSAHPQTLELARGDHPREVIFGFEFPCGWPTLRVEMITLTERAAAELKRLLASKGETEGVGLRLAVTKGGCAGWQYEMNVGQAEAGDLLVEDRGARVIVEADSVDRLRGCEIDFSDELSDSGFKIHNPRAARSCGCGTSFEPLDDPAAEDSASETKDCRA